MTTDVSGARRGRARPSAPPPPVLDLEGVAMHDRSADQDIVIVGGARTAFGDFGGVFRDVGAVELGAHACRGALERSRIAPDQVDQVIVGHAIQVSGSDAYLARHVGLKTGCPVGVPAMTVNRLGGSGLQAIVTAAQLIRL